MSLSRITQEAVISLINKLLSPHKKFESLKKIPKRNYSFNQRLSFKFHDSTVSNASNTEMTREEILDKGQKLFMKLADFLFENHKTLSDIIYPRVFYKVIDGKEYQLIKLEHLYECLENIGFCISDQDQT
jgi:hypothetical protein